MADKISGTFKQQHDTGQNLKYLIVYPHVTCAAQGTSVKGNADVDEATAVDTKSPEYIVSACELATFKEIVSSKTQSWRQRKRLLKVLQESSEYFQRVEAKLITGAPLTVKEQASYESNSGDISCEYSVKNYLLLSSLPESLEEAFVHAYFYFRYMNCC